MTFTAGQKVRASQMPGFVCTSSTRPSGHSGQYIFETDTGMLAMYDGSNWQYIAATGAIGSDAEYQASSTQTIATGTDTFVAFTTAQATSPLVTQGVTGAGHYFRLNRAGRWFVSTTVRFASAATGERYATMRVGTIGKASSGSVLGGAGAHTMNLSAAFRVASGNEGTSAADVDVRVFQNSGGNRDLEFNAGGGWGRIGISWLGP